MVPLEFNGERHRIRETPVATYIRHACKDDDRFFTYYNARAGTWVLAYWLRRGRLFVELLLADSPYTFRKDEIEWVKRWHNRQVPGCRTLGQWAKEAERAYWREQDDHLREAMEYKRYLARRGGVHNSDHLWFKVPGLAVA